MASTDKVMKGNLVATLRDWIKNNFVAKVTGKGLSTNDYDNTEKSNVASNTSARHTHSNKALLDTYTQTEANLSDAVSKKHEHSNKAVIDGIASTDITNWNGKADSSALTSHTGNTSNPHSVTKAQVGLGNVPNTDFTSPVSTLQSDLDAVEAKIPSQATSSNQLADKAFVNSSIATATATFKGTVTTSDDTEESAQIALATITGMDNNDYAFVQAIGCGTGGSDKFKRYKYDGSAWSFEYVVNNSGFTSGQWNAINSGATSAGITSATSHIADSTIHVTSSDKTNWNGKVNTSDIVDNLTSTDTDKPLSANQGKVLNEAVGSLFTYEIVSITFSTSTSASFVYGTANLTIPSGYTPFCAQGVSAHDYSILGISTIIQGNILYCSGWYNAGYATAPRDFKVWYIKT